MAFQRGDLFIERLAQALGHDGRHCARITIDAKIGECTMVYVQEYLDQGAEDVPALLCEAMADEPITVVPTKDHSVINDLLLDIRNQR